MRADLGRHRAIGVLATAALVAVYVALASIATAPVANAVTGHFAGGLVDISYSGRIGSLTIDASTGADITRALGRPGYITTGSFANAPGVSYRLFGYGCSGNACVTEYYINLGTGRLESFQTTAGRFALPGGIRVGMSANVAARLERRPIELGCRGIAVTSPKLAILLWTSGTHILGGGRLAGGRVAGIAIDDRQHGVGVGLC